MKIAIISTTTNGDKILKTLKEEFEDKHDYIIHTYNKDKIKELKLNNICKNVMNDFNGIVFISSIGIAVRGIAPFIKTKDIDPGVVVVDSLGKYTVSLLSSHLGGANDLTNIISSILDSEPIITTASDGLNLIGPDMIAKYNGLIIDDLNICKNIASLLISGEKIEFIDEKNLIKVPKGYIKKSDNCKGTIIVTNKLKIDNQNKNHDIQNRNNQDENNQNFNNTLKLIRQDIILGIGCKKNYNKNIMKDKVIKVLNDNNIDIRSVKKIATVNIKSKEEAILELAKFLKVPIETFSIEQIKSVEDNYDKSEFVKKTLGVGSVSEPVIELSKGKVIVNKLKLNGMTLSIGVL
ncbi:MAG: cobalt-precorrin 5A hydrolase [Methanobrevibacter sp.]|jgi:cobalt-precorrin 5A hydrolase|nr:cobalt-precorrin 5A hydrolase [Candidatus Methanovirga meridionalis]